MKRRYSISIPKPCHESWSTMTPNEKGRFCQSCSKTVVDFTSMKTKEVQKFIHDNKHQRICGHIRQSQLDTINLQISEGIFEQTLSFHKLFLLALLLAMGTSLLSCSDDKGRTKKIQSIEIVEKVIDSSQFKAKTKIDTSSIISGSKEEIKNKTLDKDQKTTTYFIDGKLLLGEVVSTKTNPIHPNTIVDPQPPEIIEGEIDIQDDIVLGLFTVQNPPEFKDTPQNLTSEEKREFFKKKISQFVNDNFEITQGHIALEGRQRIRTQFTIDENGVVNNIQVRAPHIWFEKETKRVIELLPQFNPASHKGKPVEITYNLPIIFEVKD